MRVGTHNPAGALVALLVGMVIGCMPETAQPESHYLPVRSEDVATGLNELGRKGQPLTVDQLVLLSGAPEVVIPLADVERGAVQLNDIYAEGALANVHRALSVLPERPPNPVTILWYYRSNPRQGYVCSSPFPKKVGRDSVWVVTAGGKVLAVCSVDHR